MSGSLSRRVGPVRTSVVAVLPLRSVSVVVAAGSCNRSWQRRLLPTHSFASYRPRHAGAAPPGWPGRRGYIWCEFLAAGATPFTASCRRPRPLPPEAAASKDTSELAPTAGVSSRGRRPGPNNRGEPSSVEPPSSAGQFRRHGPCATMRSAWAEGRALLAKQPERRPRGQHRMGRHEAARCHAGLAPRR